MTIAMDVAGNVIVLSHDCITKAELFCKGLCQ